MLVHSVFILMILMGSIAAWIKRSLTAAGAFAAFFLALVLYLSGGIYFLAALFAFFVSATTLTRYKRREKKKLEKQLYEKTGTRDHVQVLANGGAALILAIIHLIHPEEAAIVGVFTAFAACNADTWASEVGILSRKRPFSILTLKPMEKGISGGVTLLGLAAALGGAVLIAVFYLGARYGQLDLFSLAKNSALIVILGFGGAVVDSVLGALFQPLYMNVQTGRLTERKHVDKVKSNKIKGFDFFSNDMVNFISSMAMACLAYIILVCLP